MTSDNDRAATLKRDASKETPGSAARLTIAVTGANGLVGSALCTKLQREGHEPKRVLRRSGGTAGEILWDPNSGSMDAACFEGVDAVVHRAGESIAKGRWSEEAKSRILRSRTESTRLLATALASLQRKPRVFVCASAVGFYGDRGDALLDEDSAPGRGFLADVCRQWEASAEPARAAGIRVVHTRFGAVLTPKGGALAQMLTPFKLGLGGKLGSGRQFMSWVSLDDAIAAIEFCIAAESLHGPVNVTAPQPLSNEEFTHALASALHRPAFATVPAFALRWMLGEMADELLLASARVLPRKLELAGFRFHDAEAQSALRRLLQEHGAGS